MLTLLDWAIVAAYATGTIVLGWYFGRRRKSAEEYFLGSGRMNPMLIGVSSFATLLSTISYLSMPGEALGKGPAWMVNVVALPFVYLVIGFVLLPVYMRRRVTSAYELLEKRLGLSVRLLGASLFLILRLAWMALLIYLTASALSVMLGLGPEAIPWIAAAAGFVAVVYTSVGGLQAVVVTDFAQAVLLFSGALLVIAVVSLELGGFGWVPTRWDPTWDSQPLFSWDPSVRITISGTVLSYFVWFVATAGGDQTSIQRYMATGDARAARRSVGFQVTASALTAVTLAFVGFALLGYFSAFPERLSEGMTLAANADQAFPYFIASQLPAGVTGLVVAAMFAAAMSSIDSGVNSITAVVRTDFVERLGGGKASTTGAPKWTAFAIGAVVVSVSTMMGSVPGNITAVTTKTSNLLTTPIFGLFFLALFVPFATTAGAWIGTICGTATAVLIAFSGPIFGLTADGRDPVSFQWIAPAAITVDILAGCAASKWLPFGRKGNA